MSVDLGKERFAGERGGGDPWRSWHLRQDLIKMKEEVVQEFSFLAGGNADGAATWEDGLAVRLSFLSRDQWVPWYLPE